MQITHEMKFCCVCPVDASLDTYSLTVRTSRVIKVEDIHQAIRKHTAKPEFQENLTLAIAGEIGAECETVGFHSGVKTTCVCGGAV